MKSIVKTNTKKIRKLKIRAEEIRDLLQNCLRSDHKNLRKELEYLQLELNRLQF